MTDRDALLEEVRAGMRAARPPEPQTAWEWLEKLLALVDSVTAERDASWKEQAYRTECCDNAMRIAAERDALRAALENIEAGEECDAIRKARAALTAPPSDPA